MGGTENGVHFNLCL